MSTVPTFAAPPPGGHVGDVTPEVVALLRESLDTPVRPNFFVLGETEETARTFGVYMWVAPAPIVADHRMFGCYYQWRVAVDHDTGAMVSASEATTELIERADWWHQ